MRAHQVMTKQVISVDPETPLIAAANIMLQHRISGLPVIDKKDRLVGIVSEGDLIRRSEIGTEKKHSRWLHFFVSPGKLAADFVHERGRKVSDVMTADPICVAEDTQLDEVVQLMEKNNVKRLPVVRGEKLVGIVTRANLLQAVASLVRDIPDPTADDDHIRDRIIRSIEKNDWRPLTLEVTVRQGIVHIRGVITDERWRHAIIVAAENVAGVKKVHDHLCWVDPLSGMFLNSPEDDLTARAG